MKKLIAALAFIGLTAMATPSESQAQYYSATSSSGYGTQVVNTTNQSSTSWITEMSSAQLLAEFLKLNASDPNMSLAHYCSMLATEIALHQVRYAMARASGDWVMMMKTYYSIYKLKADFARLGC